MNDVLCGKAPLLSERFGIGIRTEDDCSDEPVVFEECLAISRLGGTVVD
jgi:hypothetical protein